MITTIITFCETMGYYILAKAGLFWVVQTIAGLGKKKVTFKTVKRDLVFMAVVTLAVRGAWQLALGSAMQDMVLVAALLACMRIAWRELKTFGGVLAGDWNTDNPDFCLFGIGDSDKVGTFSFGGGRGKKDYDWGAAAAKEDEFYYDARWYYQYGDGR